MKDHESFKLHKLLDNPFTTGDHEMMVHTSFNIMYNAFNGEQINIRASPALENLTQSSQTKSTNQAPEIRPEEDDFVNSQSQKKVFAESQIVQNQTESTNTTLISTKLNFKTIDNLSKYQLGMHTTLK